MLFWPMVVCSGIDWLYAFAVLEILPVLHSGN
ncbi:MAG: hypothetical protein JWN70_6338 [Planctomycetaceae bacterium]|nr:hypothetical protein [Planctomycetaceae bacterium]